MSEERPLFFLNTNKQHLYGILHFADSKKNKINNKTAIIYCDSIFEEKLHAHRISVNFSRYAAKEGFNVFRFDYYGDGESEGVFEDTSITSRINDIYAAIKFTKESLNVHSIFLLGLRLGGTLALLASTKYPQISGIVAWAPIIDTNNYIYDILRINLSIQMVLHKKVKFNRDELIDKLKKGELVNVDGYEISKKLFEELYNLDLPKEMKNSDKPILVNQISNSTQPNKQLTNFINEIKNQDVKLKIFKDREFWKAQRIVYSSYERLFFETLNWIKLKN